MRAEEEQSHNVERDHSPRDSHRLGHRVTDDRPASCSWSWGGDKIIVWLGWGQAASWLGAVSRLLGGTDAGTTPTEEKNHSGSIAAPPGGKGLGHTWSH